MQLRYIRDLLGPLLYFGSCRKCGAQTQASDRVLPLPAGAHACEHCAASPDGRAWIAALLDPKCRRCGAPKGHGDDLCPDRPDDSDPRMADLLDDSPQHEGES